MSIIDIVIHVIPNVSPTRLLGFKLERDGSSFSTAEKINVNRTRRGYTINYTSDEFMKLVPNKFVASMIKLFNNNIPGVVLNTSIEYNYEELLDSHFDEAVSTKVLEMGQLMRSISESGRVPTFKYDTSNNILNMIDLNYDNDDEDDQDDYDDDDDYEYDDYDPFARFFNDDDDDDDYRPCRNYYNRSRVIDGSHNPKRDINRHGVVIASKRDLSRDRKILKKFLKDFIPGNAGWKKDFRNDVLNRWMAMYSISKSDLKYMEKNYRRAHYKKNNDIVAKSIDMTRRMLTVPVDSWYDPNR